MQQVSENKNLPHIKYQVDVDTYGNVLYCKGWAIAKTDGPNVTIMDYDRVSGVYPKAVLIASKYLGYDPIKYHLIFKDHNSNNFHLSNLKIIRKKPLIAPDGTDVTNLYSEKELRALEEKWEREDAYRKYAEEQKRKEEERLELQRKREEEKRKREAALQAKEEAKRKKQAYRELAKKRKLDAERVKLLNLLVNYSTVLAKREAEEAERKRIEEERLKHERELAAEVLKTFDSGKKWKVVPGYNNRIVIDNKGQVMELLRTESQSISNFKPVPAMYNPLTKFLEVSLSSKAREVKVFHVDDLMLMANGDLEHKSIGHKDGNPMRCTLDNIIVDK